MGRMRRTGADAVTMGMIPDPAGATDMNGAPLYVAPKPAWLRDELELRRAEAEAADAPMGGVTHVPVLNTSKAELHDGDPDMHLTCRCACGSDACSWGVVVPGSQWRRHETVSIPEWDEPS
jgi:hypothetical protein